ncbi:MAG: GNAT family N-acetyltransferase [Actinobacteria bacterium]|nr:GNAT family N-acetyltransferase [Actinomycetota bacterium]MBU1945021.1 GNAT family N-acetyltransferase [Actinomycetota bacterium]MBU2686643.1 GNAT family N-acetyltransferase [Actinomycetota bacterium]
MRIERAGVEDAAEILELQRAAYQVEARRYDDYTIPPMTQTLDGMKSDIGEQLVLKAVNGGRIVGSVRAHTQDETCFIGRLIVHPEHQDRGIGTRLMERMEGEFPEADRFELFTGHLSGKNLHVYEKLGYREFRRKLVSDRLALVYLEKVTGK